MATAKTSVATVRSHRVPTVQIWRSRAHHPWHTCCDTRAVASAVLQIHFDDEKQSVSLIDVTDWVLEYVRQPFECTGGADLQEAFMGRSTKDISQEVLGIVTILIGEGVLVPETDGVSEYFYLEPDSIDALKLAQRSLEVSF